MLIVGVALFVGLRPMTPARTADDYRHKAKDTAESVLSSVQTARLAARVGTGGDAFGPYVSVVLSKSEEAVAKAQGSFDRVQPPDAWSDRTRTHLAVSSTDRTSWSRLRITARRGELDRLASQARPLRPLARAARVLHRRSRTGTRVKKIFGVTLGILTAMGGFVDIGDIVANSETGARFGMSLAWAVLLGVGGIIVYAEMAGRVATVTKRAGVRPRAGAARRAGRASSTSARRSSSPCSR